MLQQTDTTKTTTTDDNRPKDDSRPKTTTASQSEFALRNGALNNKIVVCWTQQQKIDTD